MDSYNFHFERMNNLELHPLSLPVSRLSPAKSISSIDQYTHHHGKGDSAYSSFSGGSSAPDYPSPFLHDDFHPHILPYADLKYVKSVCGPSILESNSKSMDQLYRSVEAIAHQHHQSNNKCLQTKDPTNSSPPPPPPIRLDSFVTTRNLESSRVRQSPEGQVTDVSSFRPQTANPEVFGSRPDSVHVWRVSPHYQRDHLKQDLMHKIPESKSASALSRLPLQASQLEHSQQTGSSQSEMEQKRSHSAYGVPAAEQQRAVNSWHMAQNKISGSIQHKGQFYFVTGVYKSPESSVLQPECVGDSSVLETHRQAEKQRSHCTAENTFKNVQWRKGGSPNRPSGELFFQEEKQVSTPDQNEMPPNYHGFHHCGTLERTSPSPDKLIDSQIVSMDVSRHHTTNHPIFYCGPEKTFSGSTTSLNKIMTPVMPEMYQNIYQSEEHVTRWAKQPLADMPTEKINKETTPLLYHLTGASRVSLINKVQNEKNSSMGWEDLERGSDKQKVGKESCSSESTHIDVFNEEKLNDSSYPCNTLDDSFKKYYKEKLKDAQTKVLRETSFKRKDLQLSRTHRTTQQTDKRSSVTTSCSPSQDVNFRMENLIHPQMSKFQEAEVETLLSPSEETEKGAEKERGKQKNVAQPQVSRLGSRKRLSSEKKKLSHSEPEKLHQLGDGPSHTSCRSLGSEIEALLPEDIMGDHGLVATRRMIFETRGRALSASSASKSTLKHLQHKALVEYMVRKTGHKVAEPQQPAPQVPRQRHSSAGRHSDGAPRPHSANPGSKKKLLRPLSAGRILDSSSIQYAQSTYAHTSSHSKQACWKEGQVLASGKSASVENLEDEKAKPGCYTTHSSSEAHPHCSMSTQVQSHFESLSAHDMDVSRFSFHIKADGKTSAYKFQAASVPEQRRMRAMAPRGKSMEELGAPVLTKSKALSKSTEHLNQLHKRHIMSSKEKRDASFLVVNQERTQQNLKQPLNGSSLNIQNRPEEQALKEPCTSENPPTVPHSSTRAFSTSSTFSACEISAPANITVMCYEYNPEAVYSNGYSCKEDKVRSSPSSQGGSSDNNLYFSKIKEDSQEQSMKAEVLPGHTIGSQRSDSVHEVSLSLGVTTDPSMWIASPEIDDAKIEEHMPESAKTEPTSAATESSTKSGPALEGDCEQKEEEKVCGSLVDEKPIGDSVNTQPQPRWETLVEDVVAADQSLARILYPITNRKTALMLMEQLLSEDNLLMEEHYKKKQEKSVDEPQQTSSEVKDAEQMKSPLASNEDSSCLITQQHTQNNTGTDVTEKKRLLIAYIEEHLQSLEGLRASLHGEEQENGTLGDSMEALVCECCVPAELERYTQFIGDLERVVSLLLCLSARLARVQNALSTVDENTDAEEKQSLDNRHHLLCKQREDAKELKENLDRRERLVSSFLTRQLTEAQLQEYRRFVQTKASLLIRLKDLDEKQRLGEEQREALLNSIPP